MRYLVVIERGDTSVGAYVPDLPGWAVVGETEEEALRLAREAVELHIEALKEQGMSVPQARFHAEVVG